MKKSNKPQKNSRRDFIAKTASSCALCCVAAPELLASTITYEKSSNDAEHKFDIKSDISIQDAYNIAFVETYIPIMRSLQKQLGQGKFIEILKKAADTMYDEYAVQGDYSANTLERWTEGVKHQLDTAWNNRLTYKVVREDSEVFEVEFTECLWAKTFKAANAADLGYAGICYQDYGKIRIYNPELELVQEKTLMQGADCCSFRWQKKA